MLVTFACGVKEQAFFMRNVKSVSDHVYKTIYGCAHDFQKRAAFGEASCSDSTVVATALTVKPCFAVRLCQCSINAQVANSVIVYLEIL